MIDPALAKKGKLRIVVRSLSVLLRSGATGFAPSLAIQFSSSSPTRAKQFDPTSNSGGRANSPSSWQYPAVFVA